MEIVKLPKKLKDALNTLRNGQIELGLAQLEKIKGFEPQKALVKAEINYFMDNPEEAMSFDEQALPFDGQWYAGNILFEHLFAYTSTSVKINNQALAEEFLANYLIEKEKLPLPAHLLNTYRHQISQHLKRLKGEKDLIISPKSLSLIEGGETKEAFVAQLKKYRPKVTLDSLEGAEYLLHFMFESGDTIEALNYYETYANQILNEDHHINAARLYTKLGLSINAKQALITYAANAWYPVEHLQITPMKLWSFEDLYPIFTKDLKEELLLMSKARS